MRSTLSLLWCLVAYPLAAQDASPAPGCPYSRCALSIAPRWNGLAVVRGREETQVANLGFFLPRDISPVFRAGGDATGPSVAEARRAVRIRKAAAVLTDAGAVLLAAGGVRALALRRVDDAGIVALSAGALGLAVSVPLQFAADGALSRAVWLHNLRFARD